MRKLFCFTVCLTEPHFTVLIFYVYQTHECNDTHDRACRSKNWKKLQRNKRRRKISNRRDQTCKTTKVMLKKNKYVYNFENDKSFNNFSQRLVFRGLPSVFVYFLYARSL